MVLCHSRVFTDLVCRVYCAGQVKIEWRLHLGGEVPIQVCDLFKSLQAMYLAIFAIMWKDAAADAPLQGELHDDQDNKDHEKGDCAPNIDPMTRWKNPQLCNRRTEVEEDTNAKYIVNHFVLVL
mmetsp:Transcript_44193/g.82224  ORF Transcript_44193/g.82224 Transcript_44193/m.82224 type:complete len:124 (+) Transcript_44193:63-434(+)